MTSTAAEELAEWSAELDRLPDRFAGRFAGSKQRRRARQYLSGLVADLDRANGWTLAVQAGELTPDGMQWLLRWADWDVDAVRASRGLAQLDPPGRGGRRRTT